MEHSLLVVELKKPSETIEVEGQAQFYAVWTRAPFYVITNGRELAVYRIEPFFHDVLELCFPLCELASHWQKLKGLLAPSNVAEYCIANKLKAINPAESRYGDYVSASLLLYDARLRQSLSRSVTAHSGLPTLAAPICLSAPDPAFSEVSAAPYAEVVEQHRTCVLLSEPGGGKTYLLQLIARDAFAANLQSEANPVPVFIPAKLWSRSFRHLAQAVHQAVRPFSPDSLLVEVEAELRAGRFLILIDGLDEVLQAPDALTYEILQIAQSTRSRLIVTCRSSDYHQQLQDQFDAFVIDPLTPEQIEQYASRVLGRAGEHFLYSIGPDLSDLVRNPLLLMMTILVMDRAPGHRLPKNRANLYRHFATLLLTEWQARRADEGAFVVDQETKEAALAQYAWQTRRRIPSDRVLNAAIQAQHPIWPAPMVRRELLKSGLLVPTAHGPDFFHPSFREFFAALHLATSPDADVRSFIESEHRDDRSREVFAFLAGLLQDADRQALLLDFLEEANLRLYRACLLSRFERITGGPASWSASQSFDYLNQLRLTYERIVGALFPEIKLLLPPWNAADDVPQEAAYGYELQIEGGIDPTVPSAAYELRAVAPTDPTPRVVVREFRGVPFITIGGADGARHTIALSSLSLGNQRSHDLRYADQGLDSAREIAFREIRKSVYSLLDARRLGYAASYYLICESAERYLQSLNHAAKRKRSAEFRELRDLSLYTVPLDHILHLLVGWYERLGATLDVHVLIYQLASIKDSGVEVADFLLPPADLTKSETPRRARNRSWNTWSLPQLADRIAKFYTWHQASYRYLVETCFPKFRDELFFYSIGPVKVKANIYRPNRGTEDGWVRVFWEPVATMHEMGTEISVIGEPDREEPDDAKFDRLAASLRDLGRPTRGLSTGGGHRLEHYFSGGDILHQEVYKQLRRDFELILGRD